MWKKNARPLYIGRRHAVAAGRVASPLTWLPEVGGRSAAEASSPLVAQCPEAMQRRSFAVAGAFEKTHRRRVAARRA